MDHLASAPLPHTAETGVRQREMIDLVARFARDEGLHATVVDRLHLIRVGGPSACLPGIYQPGLCLAVQGSKQVTLGSEVFRYDPLHFLLASVTLPVQGQIIEASPERPYLCVRIDVDPREIGDLILEAGSVPTESGPDRPGCGLQVSAVTGSLLDAVLRLLRLLEHPGDVPVLAPLALREIYYRVLSGGLGPRLRQLALADSQAQRVARAVDLIKRRFAEPLRIDDLAAAAHMSPSNLHHRFKAVTAMSPLQFQKQLRLHEARRLMLSEGLEAAAAGHRVGYESPSQFSRDYKRLFGAPPRREISDLRTGGIQALQ